MQDKQLRIQHCDLNIVLSAGRIIAYNTRQPCEPNERAQSSEMTMQSPPSPERRSHAALDRATRATGDGSTSASGRQECRLIVGVDLRTAGGKSVASRTTCKTRCAIGRVNTHTDTMKRLASPVSGSIFQTAKKRLREFDSHLSQEWVTDSPAHCDNARACDVGVLGARAQAVLVEASTEREWVARLEDLEYGPFVTRHAPRHCPAPALKSVVH